MRGGLRGKGCMQRNGRGWANDSDFLSVQRFLVSSFLATRRTFVSLCLSIYYQVYSVKHDEKAFFKNFHMYIPGL